MFQPEELSLFVSESIILSARACMSQNITLEQLPGYTGLRQRRFLNALGRCIRRYFEVGVFHGASLLSASWGNHQGVFVGVDNFVEGNRAALNKNIAGHRNVFVFDLDVHSPAFSEFVAAQSGSKFDVLFFDANTSPVALLQAASAGLLSCMEENFIWIVDNWNRPKARNNFDRLLQLYDYSMFSLFDIRTDVDCDIDSWWSGWGIAVVQKKKPPVEPSWYDLKGGGPPLWDVKARREQGLITIEEYRKRGL